MARVQVNPDELKGRKIPEGVYPANIEDCELGEWKGKNKVRFQFRVDGADDPTFNGRTVSLFASVEPGEGDRYLRTVRALGLDPGDFDTGQVVGLPVYIRVKHAMGKRTETGEQEIYENVAEVSPR